MGKDPWKGFTQALIASNEKRPTGPYWLTKHELAEKLGKNLDAVESIINRNRDSFERFVGFVVSNNRLVGRVWYRPINNATKPNKVRGGTGKTAKGR